jgi:dipeptidyl aminopeptidase/acylaminoacyl peptidase
MEGKSKVNRGGIMKPSIFRLSAIITLCVWAMGTPGQDTQKPESFRLDHDGIELQCYFHRATGEGPFPTIILLQGWPSGGKDSMQIGETLAGSGINSFTIHYRGTFLSEGVFAFKDLMKDLDFIYNLLRTEDYQEKLEIDTSKIIMGGHSFGGAMSMVYAASNPEIKSVFSVGAPDHSQLASEYINNPQLAEMLDASFARREAPEGPVRGGVASLQDMVANPDMHDLRKMAPNFQGKKLLLIGGWEDSGPVVEHHLVPFYRALKKAGVEDVKIVTYHTGHSFRNVRKQLADDILKWISEI